MSSSMPSVAGAAPPEERRVDADGQAYTRAEFFAYYSSDDAWHAAPAHPDFPPASSTSSLSSAPAAAPAAGVPAPALAPTDKRAPPLGRQPSFPAVAPAPMAAPAAAKPKLVIKESSVRSFQIRLEGDDGEAIAAASAVPGTEQAVGDGEGHDNSSSSSTSSSRHHRQRSRGGDKKHSKKHHHHHHHSKSKSRSSSKRGGAAGVVGQEQVEPEPVAGLAGSGRTRSSRSQSVQSPTHEDDHADAKKAFDMYDVDNDGSLDEGEVGKALAELGIQISPLELSVIFAEYDVDGNGTLDLPEFTLMMGRQRCNADSKDSLRQAFAKCDTDGSGTLEITELRQIMKEFGVVMDDDELEEIFEEADTDGNGTICYDEFVEIMGTGD